MLLFAVSDCFLFLSHLKSGVYMSQEQFEQLLQEQKRTNELLHALLQLSLKVSLGGEGVVVLPAG